MMQKSLSISADFSRGMLCSLQINQIERLTLDAPLFRISVRKKDGSRFLFSSFDAKTIEAGSTFGRYRGFGALALSADIGYTEKEGELSWSLSAKPNDPDLLIEWMDAPLLNLPSLKSSKNQLLLPYNEGALVEDETLREGRREPEYPSLGSDFIFPNMLSAQMMTYLFEDCGLYIAAHDPARSVKGLDFEPIQNGLQLRLRLYSGAHFGEAFSPDYPILWSIVGNRWEDGAERYRCWLEKNLPPRAAKITENPNLPAWYPDAPLVVTYPIRGWHDTDEMTPNALFPYCNALPLLDRIAKESENRLLVLLMHWEGTAPWAPPYTWPPYGSEELFFEFRKALKERGHLMGVYCSGFGYTQKSNLTDYQGEDPALHRAAFCADEKGDAQISKICTKQRAGFDICPASPEGKALLDKAYQPLFECGIDYAQILDQNHGGGQYFCLSSDHGHPAAPGRWMTENMQALLTQWNHKAPQMLFGCESAAAEPFIGNLLFSDNRFELNYKFGKAVPLYAYLFHEYLRNFMGNQVGCPFSEEVDSLPWRLGYSFAAGDCMTLALTPDGRLFSRWGSRDLQHCPSWDHSLTLIRNLTRFYQKKGKSFLYCGRMIPAAKLECETLTFPLRNGGVITLPALHATAWEAKDGKKAQIIVNPTPATQSFTLGGKGFEIAPLDALLIAESN